MGDAAAMVERYLAALRVQDWPALAATLERDVERTGPFNDVYRGRDAYVAFLAEIFPTLRGYQLDVTRVVALSGVVLVELSETIDLPDGRRRTDEAVVFDLSPAGLIRRVGVYIRR
jgi:hypothetical protein